MNTFIILVILLLLAVCVLNYRKTERISDEIKAIRSILAQNSKEPAETLPPPVPDFMAECETATPCSEPANDIITPDSTAPDPLYLTASEPTEPTGRAARKLNLEKIVGENIFSRIGILALVTGIGFFVKYAIDNNWINETARTALGLLAGAGLWGTAYRLRDRYRNFSSVLAGGGFAVCFVTIAVAYNFYHILDGWMTLAVFVLLSAIMTFISLRFDRRELALMAIAGAYIAPFLASGENGNPVMLLSYTAILSAALFVITMKRGWWELPVAGTVMTWIIVAVIGLHDGLSAREHLCIVGFSTLFFTLFSLPLATVMSRDRSKSLLFTLLMILSVANPLAYLACSLTAFGNIALPVTVRGAVPLYISAVYGALYFRFYRRSSDNTMQTILLWCVIVFSALFIPLQFSSPSILALSFSIYALLLTVAFATSGRKMFISASAIMTVVNAAYLTEQMFAGNASGYSTDMTLMVNGLCYIAIAGIADRRWEQFGSLGSSVRCNLYGITLNFGCALAALATGGFADKLYGQSAAAFCLATMLLILPVAVWGRLTRYTSGFMPVLGILTLAFSSTLTSYTTLVSGTMHWLATLTLAIDLYLFGRRVFRTGDSGSHTSNAVFYSLIGSVFLMTCIFSAIRGAGLEGYYSAGFSVALIVSGALLMIAGMHYRIRPLRVISLVFFCMLFIKLVAYDLWQLPMVGRIIVFILSGGVLLSLSFLYQRLRTTLFRKE